MLHDLHRGRQCTAANSGGTFTGSIVNTAAVSAFNAAILILGVGSTVFSGNITNSGALSAAAGDGFQVGGVAANGFGTFAGSIVNKGAISAHGTAVDILDAGSSLFTGGITNAGVLTAAAGRGLLLSSIANGAGGTLAGSIVNTSAISAEKTGIFIAEVGASLFGGGITNLGKIASVAKEGIVIKDVASSGTFTGGIVNKGAISSLETAIDIAAVGDSVFSGGITNTGALAYGVFAGIAIKHVAADGTFAGRVVNSGALTGSGTAIGLFGVGASAFSGGITNSGKILSRTGAGIVVSAVADQGSFTGSHHNSSQFIDLINVTSAANVSATFSAGVLRVSSGTTVVAAIHLAGAYVTSNFHIGSGISGSVAITDPAAPNGGVVSGPAAAFPRQGVDLPNIAFGAHPTLAYSQNAADTGGTLTVTDGRHAASIALLGNYMAGSFVTAADGHGGMLVKQTPLSEQQPLLTHPRA